MFIYNISLNKKKYFKYFCILVIILLIIMFFISIFKIYSKSTYLKLSDEINNNIVHITANNYTNILKTVHEDLNSYIGKKIHFTGYIYRVLDIKDNEFILARNMIINSNYQAVVVGFLCSNENAKNFTNDTWVEITGEITKGDYHGDIPLIKVTEIKETQKPNNEFVYPPDDSYIPTSNTL